jgi:hypothetical protein
MHRPNALSCPGRLDRPRARATVRSPLAAPIAPRVAGQSAQKRLAAGEAAGSVECSLVPFQKRIRSTRAVRRGRRHAVVVRIGPARTSLVVVVLGGSTSASWSAPPTTTLKPLTGSAGVATPSTFPSGRRRNAAVCAGTMPMLWARRASASGALNRSTRAAK